MKTKTSLIALASLLFTLTAYAQPALTGLTLSEGSLNPGFNSNTLNYTATVPYDTDSIKVTATAVPGTPINLNNQTITSGVASPAQSLEVGENLLRVGVFGNSAVFYDVVVTRQGAPAPILTGLTLSNGTLSPNFDSATKSYTASVPYSVESITITSTAPAGMLISIGGRTQVSGEPSESLDLTVGSNEGRIVVFSGDTVEVYTVVVTRGAASAPVLTGLTISSGTLTPDFDPNTLNYTVAVPYSVSSVSMTATADAGTTLTLNGQPLVSGQQSALQSLTVGDNTFVIALYTDSAAAYNVVVTREAGSAPVLTGLSLSAGTLTPEFNSNTKSYTAEVPYAEASVSVIATAPDGMVISLDGKTLTSGSPSAPKALNVGENNVRVSVLSGGAGDTYTVVVTRLAAVSGPVLTGLSLSDGTLNPQFDSNTRAYTASVPYSVSDVMVTATALPGTILSLNGVGITSGDASAPQTLSVGENELVIGLFTDSASSYTVTVTRAVAPAPILSGLSLSEGSLNPEFDSNTKSYTATVPYTATSIAMTASAPAGMVMNLQGELLHSGQPSSPLTITVGVNNFQVSVLSGSVGTTYDIAVTRESAPAPELTGLTLGVGTLTPDFSSSVKNYTAVVPIETTSVTVTATAANGTIITMNGQTLESGQPSAPQNLNVGENPLNLTLFTESSTIYNVIVTRSAGEQPRFTGRALQGDKLTLTWIGSGTLQSTPDFGTWTSIPTSGNSYITPVSGASYLFYRIEQ